MYDVPDAYLKLGQQRLIKLLRQLSPPANGEGVAVVNFGLHLHSTSDFNQIVES